MGTCGFSFKDWKGTVYPQTLKDADILSYYSRSLGFDTVEIDSSYYSFLSRTTVAGWDRKTPPGFLFAVKCHREMTQNEEKDLDSLKFPDLELFRKFLGSFDGLISSGKLLCFLAQFGPLFRKSAKTCDFLAAFREALGSFPLVAEFRHSSWLSPEEKDHTLRLLRDYSLLYAMVDLPHLRSLPPFVPAATGEIAYMRLHGRNRNWFRATREERYDYLYTDEELKEFIPAITCLAGTVKHTMVFFNNCHAGAALRNALKLKDLMGLESPLPAQPMYIQGELPLGN
ncbi:MAG: DUF72 domain-containing protein [Candidatus Eremiobacteraeota bacterium]|nr:DUF72 domain-containing protein [Candidatus Eremiobacteraeota bacterium]